MDNTAQSGKTEELLKRVLFTIALLVIFRVVSQVPVPGIDGGAMKAFFDQNSATALGMLNKFTGGALERFSVLALGVMPYITSSIIFSLLTVSFPYFTAVQKEPDGHKKITQWSRYFTVVLCLFQGFGLATMMEAQGGAAGGSSVVINPGMQFKILAVLTMTAGTMFVMWLGEQITERGIGNGISLIIFAGIAAAIPGGIRDTISLWNSGELKPMVLLIFLASIPLIFWVVIYLERAIRKIPVQYAKRVVNNRVYGGQQAHLPVKLNISGVMPPIFASALMSAPVTVANFVPESWASLKWFADKIMAMLIPGELLYGVIFFFLNVFFAYFYAQIQFKTKDISESLQKNGGYIPGIRPGEQTAGFLDSVVAKLTLFGGVYIGVICSVPFLMMSFLKIPGNVAMILGGTSLLILVGVAIDTLGQIESFLISDRYNKMYKSRGKYNGARAKRF